MYIPEKKYEHRPMRYDLLLRKVNGDGGKTNRFNRSIYSNKYFKL